jgi:UDP-GlcNAc:undecaprenyl-phosphate/decaprenyl-phosphate GlcNAc-1-phosphate transferase
MSELIFALFPSFIIAFLIIRYQRLHTRYSGDNDLTGPQKFHSRITPRIGGIAIGIGLLVGQIFQHTTPSIQHVELALLACSIPTFAVGLAEDLTKKITIKIRLFFSAISGILFITLLQIQINKVDVPFLDLIFAFPFAGAVFTVFAITGLINAYNIIDGFNGLASGVGILILLGICYLGLVLADPLITHLSFVMIGAILGFFFLNYPRGLIFLGDGGAYLIGFWIATLCILIVTRHTEISPWFPIAINSYPIFETLFSIYRRSIHRGKSSGVADGVHLHTLIYRRILTHTEPDNTTWLTNAKTSPYLWAFSILGIIPAIVWPYSTGILILSVTAFAVTYVWIYLRIVTFKTPKWLRKKILSRSKSTFSTRQN